MSWGSEGSPYVFDDFDRAKKNIDTILIIGTIEFRHPADGPDKDSAPEMMMKCKNIIFGAGSKVVTKAALRITATKMMSGAITIASIRAKPGADGAYDKNIYDLRSRPDKPMADDGGNGDNASDDPFHGHGSGEGGPGHDGARGDDGALGLDGDFGRPASKAARIILYAGTYAAGTMAQLTSIGADGGKGQDGGISRPGCDRHLPGQ